MKKTLIVLLTLMLSLAFAQDGEAPSESTENIESPGVSGTAIIGGISIGGKNYQQIGFRFDVPIGKFGFGLDAQLLIDEDGNILLRFKGGGKGVMTISQIATGGLLDQNRRNKEAHFLTTTTFSQIIERILKF